MRSFGMEEELLVDARSGLPRAVAGAVLAAADRHDWQPGRHERGHRMEKELQREKLECATRPVTRTGELQEAIRHWCREAARHAETAGAMVAAIAAAPLPVRPLLNAGRRYAWMGEQSQEQLTCGCHVHVAVESDEEAVAFLGRIRPWLSVPTAISANSPYWQGENRGYAGYRSRVWNGWPCAGPVDVFGSADHCHEQVAAMVGPGVLRDRGMIYFDARPAAVHPTVEIRVTDPCPDSTAPVLPAALTPGLVETAARAWRDGRPPDRVGTSLLRPASWRAGRSGLDGPPPHPRTMRETSPRQAVGALHRHVREARVDHGADDPVREGIASLERHANGASTRRRLLRDEGGPARMVTRCAELTTDGENTSGQAKTPLPGDDTHDRAERTV
ncbi:glutamate--cysteine ligase [Streptomyces sp. NPDC059070]|uniref:glutamate--cysteine ligase n=1 Tax=Streptomyces sp. NPDC059070 TaxID=3346713 RepID=UPI0036A48E91